MFRMKQNAWRSAMHAVTTAVVVFGILTGRVETAYAEQRVEGQHAQGKLEQSPGCAAKQSVQIIAPTIQEAHVSLNGPGSTRTCHTNTSPNIMGPVLHPPKPNNPPLITVDNLEEFTPVNPDYSPSQHSITSLKNPIFTNIPTYNSAFDVSVASDINQLNASNISININLVEYVDTSTNIMGSILHIHDSDISTNSVLVGSDERVYMRVIFDYNGVQLNARALSHLNPGGAICDIVQEMLYISGAEAGFTIISYIEHAEMTVFNQEIAGHRARSVRYELIQRCGVPADVLFALDGGTVETAPTTPINHPSERRIEFVIVPLAN